MKTAPLLSLALVASASAFAPSMDNGRASTSLNIFGKKAAPAPAAKEPEKKPLASRIFDMDLFAPKADQNDYGARTKKASNGVGKLGAKSYVPSGMSKAQYEKIRAEGQAKKDANYKRNVAKAGKFTDYTEWYKKRGTDLAEGWAKTVTNGHTMVKTKFDWSGGKDGIVEAKGWAKEKK